MAEHNSRLLQLSSTFRKLLKKITHEWNKRMGDTYSFTQFRMLYALSSKGPQKAADLAEILCVTSGAVTGLADKLIEKKFIERQRSEDDRRVVYLRVTELGSGMLESMLEKQKETISLFFEGLSPEDIGHLERIFALMMERVEHLEKEE